MKIIKPDFTKFQRYYSKPLDLAEINKGLEKEVKYGPSCDTNYRLMFRLKEGYYGIIPKLHGKQETLSESSEDYDKKRLKEIERAVRFAESIASEAREPNSAELGYLLVEQTYTDHFINQLRGAEGYKEEVYNLVNKTGFRSDIFDSDIVILDKARDAGQTLDFIYSHLGLPRKEFSDARDNGYNISDMPALKSKIDDAKKLVSNMGSLQGTFEQIISGGMIDPSKKAALTSLHVRESIYPLYLLMRRKHPLGEII